MFSAKNSPMREEVPFEPNVQVDAGLSKSRIAKRLSIVAVNVAPGGDHLP
jgi:hypothetical protein